MALPIVCEQAVVLFAFGAGSIPLYLTLCAVKLITSLYAVSIGHTF